MRLPAFALAALVAFPATLPAQGYGQRFGAIIGGATLSDISNYYNSTDSRWGFTGGLMVGMNHGATATSLEALYVQKGAQDVGLDYIEIPFTFGAAVPVGQGAGRFRFYGGIAVAFKVSCDGDDIGCDDANGTEFSLPFGVQFAKVSGDRFFGADIRYGLALSDAFDTFEASNRPWYFRVFFGKALGM